MSTNDPPEKQLGNVPSPDDKKESKKLKIVPDKPGPADYDPFAGVFDHDTARKRHRPLIELLKHYGDVSVPEVTKSPWDNLLGLLTPATPTVQDLETDILKLRAEFAKQTAQLRTERASKQEHQTRVKNLTKTLTELQNKQELAFLLTRITPRAENAIVQSKEARDSFFSAQPQAAFVVAIDIRRSTELMLKARTPTLFAAFMTDLCSRLEGAIKEEYGVFDKFTGDGVLAFFPEFFSGKDAGYHALAAAQKALNIFTECYRRNRTSFTTVLRDVHLAVGIDYGPVHLMQVAGGLTVVGSAVVYACRLSGGPAGTILLNQPAYEQISNSYGSLCLIKETEIDIKHEGGIICYELSPGNKPFVPAEPPWIAESLSQVAE